MTLSKSQINKVRLELIRVHNRTRYGRLLSLRDAVFPTVSDQAFRQWFKPNNGKYWISDEKLCKMEEHLGIVPNKIRERIRLSIPESERPNPEVFKGMIHGVHLPSPVKEHVA